MKEYGSSNFENPKKESSHSITEQTSIEKKEQMPLPEGFLACEEIRIKLFDDIDQDIRLLSNFDPEYSPNELEGITKKYNLIPRNNFKVVVEQLKNIKEKIGDNDFFINTLRDINYKVILSESEPEEAIKRIYKSLIFKAAQKH